MSVFFKILVAFAIVCTTCVGQSARALKQTARPPLTPAQIDNLLFKVKTPDEVISLEIRERGVAVVPTRAYIEMLAGKGAGPQTLAALRALATGVINITSRPGECDVMIDGKPVGRTRADGHLAVTGVASGEHIVQVQKEAFQAAEFRIVLDAGGQASVAAALETAAGSLTVLTNVPDASIQIPGVGAYRGAARNVRCPAGSYELEVTAPRYTLARQTVVIAPGKLAQISIDLEPDADALEDLRQRLRLTAKSGSGAGSVRLAQELLRYSPADPDATAVLAVNHFLSGDGSAFRSTALKTLELGGSINLRRLHHHSFMQPHEAVVSLHARGLTFDPLGATCSVRTGLLGAERIAEVRVTRERLRSGRSYAYAEFVDIRFRPEDHGDKTSSIKLTTPDERAVSALTALADTIRSVAKN